MYFDTHAHIASIPEKYSDIDEVIAHAKQAGITKIVDAGINIDTSRKALKLHEKYPDIILPTAGLHPEIIIPGADIYVKNFDTDKAVLNLKKLLKTGKFVAVGECGLDHYWLNKSTGLTQNTKFKIQNFQKELFAKQIDLAVKYKLPLVVHSRGAESECCEVLSSSPAAHSPQLRVLFHSFTGSLEVAKRVLKAGYYISFNGIITYAKAGDIREIFAFAWKDYPNQILAETDAPYLAPEPKRGEVCGPADVVLVVRKMGEIAELPIEDIRNVVYRNSIQFYK